jgi:hypothetical protein
MGGSYLSHDQHGCFSGRKRLGAAGYGLWGKVIQAGGCVAAPVVRPKSVEGWSNMDQPMMAYPDILKLTSEFVTAQKAVSQFRQVTTCASETAKFASEK